MYCSHCGKKVKNDAQNFCMYCGAKLFKPKKNTEEKTMDRKCNPDSFSVSVQEGNLSKNATVVLGAS